MLASLIFVADLSNRERNLIVLEEVTAARKIWVKRVVIEVFPSVESFAGLDFGPGHAQHIDI